MFYSIYVVFFFRKEEEIGLDNFKEVEVPVEYEDRFKKMDQDFIEDS